MFLRRPSLKSISEEVYDVKTKNCTVVKPFNLSCYTRVKVCEYEDMLTTEERAVLKAQQEVADFRQNYCKKTRINNSKLLSTKSTSNYYPGEMSIAKFPLSKCDTQEKKPLCSRSQERHRLYQEKFKQKIEEEKRLKEKERSTYVKTRPRRQSMMLNSQEENIENSIKTRHIRRRSEPVLTSLDRELRFQHRRVLSGTKFSLKNDGKSRDANKPIRYEEFKKLCCPNSNIKNYIADAMMAINENIASLDNSDSSFSADENISLPEFQLETLQYQNNISKSKFVTNPLNNNNDCYQWRPQLPSYKEESDSEEDEIMLPKNLSHSEIYHTNLISHPSEKNVISKDYLNSLVSNTRLQAHISFTPAAVALDEENGSSFDSDATFEELQYF